MRAVRRARSAVLPATSKRVPELGQAADDLVNAMAEISVHASPQVKCNSDARLWIVSRETTQRSAVPGDGGRPGPHQDSTADRRAAIRLGGRIDRTGAAP
jgi:hypothetical protein